MATKNNAVTDEDVEVELYAKRQKIYPREVHGLFATLRWLAVAVLLGGYYLVAWINWDGRQILLFDLPDRKFHIFMWTFWPQDFFLLAIMLIMAALSLFFLQHWPGGSGVATPVHKPSGPKSSCGLNTR